MNRPVSRVCMSLSWQNTHGITGLYILFQIDVHYSLPRADETSGICDREKNQGTLLIKLANEREANPMQVRRMFSGFGLIKDLRPGPARG